MGGFQGRNDALKLTHQAQGIEGLLVGDCGVLSTPDLPQVAVLRPHSGVIETCTDGVGLHHLTVAVLQQQAHGAVKHTGSALGDRRGVATGGHTITGGLNTDQPHRRVLHKGMEQAHGIGATANAGHQHVGQPRLPDVLMACVGGGSNAMGLFHPFVQDTSVRLIGVEAAGDGVATGRHAATITEGRAGVLHGAMSLLLQDGDGQVMEAHSISAGLDYPGVGPEHSYLREIGRAEYAAVTDQQALDALRLVSELEGIIPALETAHAFAWLEQLCPTLADGTEVVINCSGRGDKDVNTVAEKLGDQL